MALPGANSPDFKRCGQGCASTSGPGNLVACGHMYLDGGGFLSFSVNSQMEDLLRALGALLLVSRASLAP